MVEYVATFKLFKPIDMTKANGLLSYQVANRGLVYFGEPDNSGAVTHGQRLAGRHPAPRRYR